MRDFGAIPNDNLDHTTEINSALLAAKNAGSESFIFQLARTSSAEHRRLGRLGSSSTEQHGNTFHAGDPTYQNAAAIAVSYGSRFVTVEDCYITTYLGDPIYVGGSLVNNGELRFGVPNVTIRGCVLKERFGNVLRSQNGGSRNRQVAGNFFSQERLSRLLPVRGKETGTMRMSPTSFSKPGERSFERFDRSSLTIASTALDSRSAGGNVWNLLGSGKGLDQVINVPDGTMITLLNGSGGTVTIRHNTATTWPARRGES